MKPILFNTEMVRAILDGRKTVTRRAVKFRHGLNPTWTGYVPDGAVLYGSNNIPAAKSPYRPGDILYVRETFCPFDADHVIDGVQYAYKADATQESECTRKGFGYKWQPSIHMPKEAARLFLRVKGVRVERLHDITEDWAKQEGIQYTDFGTYLPNWKMSIDGGKTFHNPQKELHHPGYHIGWAGTPDQCYPTARGAYHALWDSTIKPADRAIYGWAANPWVWVIEFERITKEVAEDG